MQPLSYKQFLLSHLSDDVTPDAALKKYEAYTKDFKQKLARKFFERHWRAEWLQRRYNPLERRRAEDARAAAAKVAAAHFGASLRSGDLAAVSFDAPQPGGRGTGSEAGQAGGAAASQNEGAGAKAADAGAGASAPGAEAADPCLLLVRPVPEEVADAALLRWARQKVQEKNAAASNRSGELPGAPADGGGEDATKGIAEVLSSEPPVQPPADFFRFCWLRCATAAAAAVVQKALNGEMLPIPAVAQPKQSKPALAADSGVGGANKVQPPQQLRIFVDVHQPSRPRLLPPESQQPGRLKRDLEQVTLPRQRQLRLRPSDPTPTP